MSMLVRGEIDPDGSPKIKFGISKDLYHLPGTEFTGLIDTGFTGFAQIPLSEAHRLNLDMGGTTTVMVADNRVVNFRTALALAILDGQSERGTFHVSENLPVFLLGMDFLRKFHKALIVSRSLGVMVVDEDYLGGALGATELARQISRTE